MGNKSLLNSALVAMILVVGCETDLRMCYQPDGIDKLAKLSHNCGANDCLATRHATVIHSPSNCDYDA
jgi:hypothetical protein